MKIVVCIKQIQQVYNRSGMDPQKNFLEERDHICRINIYDEAALEAALRLKDHLPETEIILLTLGEIIAEGELRRCLALGADSIYHIDTNLPNDSRGKANLLATHAKKLGANLVLCGKESMDRQNGQFPAYLAHSMGLPFVSAIVDIEYTAALDRVTVTQSHDRGYRVEVRCGLPAVLSVDLGMITYRIPKRIDIEIAAEKTIYKVFDRQPQMELAVSVLETLPTCPRTMEEPAPGSNLPAFQRVQKLLTSSRINKKCEMIEGDSDTLVEGILTFLRGRGFLDTN